MEEENNKKREEYSTRIGPLLKAIFEKQKKIVSKTAWDCITPSDYEVGEILAKKLTESKLV